MRASLDIRRLPFLLRALAALFLTVVAGCSGISDKGSGRDLDDIESSGVLRVVVRPRSVSLASRGITQVLIDRKLARALAEAMDLRLKLVVMDDKEAMLESLRSGGADVIAAGLRGRLGKGLAFSIPYRYTDEILVVKKTDSKGPRAPLAESLLKGSTVCLSPDSKGTGAVKYLRGLGVSKFVESRPDEGAVDVLERLEGGECLGAVLDSVSWDEVSDDFESLAVDRVIEKSLPVALVMRAGAVQLRRRVNEFLFSKSLSTETGTKYTLDLDGIKKKKVLRMLTRNNSLTYFIYRGMPVGFEYEMMKRFADTEGLRLEVILPPGHSELLPWLKEGRADVVAAAMTMTDERKKECAFTIPYNYVDEVVVVREGDKRINSPKDLTGKTVHVRKSSAFYESLMKLKKEGLDFEIYLLPEDMETEDILDGVAEHRWDITVADSNLLRIERENGRKLRAAFTLGKRGLGWAVRKSDVKLLTALNAFIKKEYRGLFYNTLKEKYFKNPKMPEDTKDGFRYYKSGRISPYDDLVKKYAGMYGLDWRLVVAQMFQESGFNPRKRSWAGAKGLMQVMPRTARELGIKDLYDPESSIKAGTYYMKKLLERFSPAIKLQDRISFALAAYHVGYNHVADARKLARRQGLNPDVWFGNVEKAMLLLQKRAYYRKTRYGYCNGRRTVNYVRSILERYNAYLRPAVQKAA